MSDEERQVILITGANRGIGRALFDIYVARDNTAIIAAVRDPSSSSAKTLTDAACGSSTDVLVVKLDSKSEADAQEAVKLLRDRRISKIDVTIANAGIGTNIGPLIEAKGEHVLKHVDVNVNGPLRLFQATLPLLQRSSRPRFVILGSAIGSIGGMEKRPFPMFTYGASKSMAHYLIRKIHFEHEDMVAFAVDPGFTQSDMGNEGARMFGLAEAPVKLTDSAQFIVAQIEAATRQSHSGRFPTIEGDFFEW